MIKRQRQKKMLMDRRISRYRNTETQGGNKNMAQRQKGQEDKQNREQDHMFKKVPHFNKFKNKELTWDEDGIFFSFNVQMEL